MLSQVDYCKTSFVETFCESIVIKEVCPNAENTETLEPSLCSSMILTLHLDVEIARFKLDTVQLSSTSFDTFHINIL